MTKVIEAPLTIKDCLTLLPGVSERALRETINKLGCASKIGGQYYLDADDFRSLMEGCKISPSERTSGNTSSNVSSNLITHNSYEKALELVRNKSRESVTR